MTKHRVRILTGDNIPERFEGVLDANAAQGWRFLSMLPSAVDALCWVEQREEGPPARCDEECDTCDARCIRAVGHTGGHDGHDRHD